MAVAITTKSMDYVTKHVSHWQLFGFFVFRVAKNEDMLSINFLVNNYTI